MAADRSLRRIGLRLRIAAVAAIAVGVALAVGVFLVVGLLRSRLDTAATTAATLRARDIAALASADALPAQLALPGEESALVQVVDAIGAVIASTGNIDGEPAVSAERPLGTAPLEFTTTVQPLDGSQDMRFVAVNADTPNGPVVVYAGESLERAEDTTAAITHLLLLALPILVAVVGAVTWWAVGRTLRPVRTITRTMAASTTSDLHRRVPESFTTDEIGELATTVNDTLSRLETSIERQRRFVADASHELRGPLAALRADLEISVTHPERTTWRDVARDMLSDVERLQHLTDDLLVLARIDNESPRPRRPVDLAHVVAEAVRAVRGQDLQVTSWGLDVSAIIDGDEDQLRRMVRNLIHNAEGHAQTHVDIVLESTTGVVRLIVADDGPGISPGDRERVFERFVRLDTARTRDASGSGLGLAIVHEVVGNHHGTVTITDTHPHGATFAVEIPGRSGDAG
jgi:signal transduction histidine kinase